MPELFYRITCGAYVLLRRLSGRSAQRTDSLVPQRRRTKLIKGVSEGEAVDTWGSFIEASIIPESSESAGLCHAGYVGDGYDCWCLPSWIWTNAATVRMLCCIGKIDKAKQMGEKLIELQQDCGGWIVRNDYASDGAHPMLAPNDSAYIANNAMLTLYQVTGDDRYLVSAERCAQWIQETAREDGMVYLGLDMRTGAWNKRNNIVDTGFTAGLFARLYEITQKEEYLTFLKRFVEAFIHLFYNTAIKGFATSLYNDKQIGGMFGRGQAWALEGLIPAYRVLKDYNLKMIIDDLVLELIKRQHMNGGWAYNLTREYLGEDCKAVSVIAKDLMDWYAISSLPEIKQAAEKALLWCCKNTVAIGEARGGIFSFCMEGAIVQYLNTSTAFVYASAYAIELFFLLERKAGIQ